MKPFTNLPLIFILCILGYGARPFLLAISGVSGTKGSTRLFLKLKAFMPEMKPNSTWARDVLMCTKQKSKLIIYALEFFIFYSLAALEVELRASHC
jgi:hypothetical protein